MLSVYLATVSSQEYLSSVINAFNMLTVNILNGFYNNVRDKQAGGNCNV